MIHKTAIVASKAKISSNVSVFPTEPLSNPLEDWLDSCHYIKERVPNDVLILPAHNEPFRGLHERLNNLIQRLEVLSNERSESKC